MSHQPGKPPPRRPPPPTPARDPNHSWLATRSRLQSSLGAGVRAGFWTVFSPLWLVVKVAQPRVWPRNTPTPVSHRGERIQRLLHLLLSGCLCRQLLLCGSFCDRRGNFTVILLFSPSATRACVNTANCPVACFMIRI